MYVKLTSWRRNGLVRCLFSNSVGTSGYVASNGVIGRVIHCKGYGRRWS